MHIVHSIKLRFTPQLFWFTLLFNKQAGTFDDCALSAVPAPSILIFESHPRVEDYHFTN